MKQIIQKERARVRRIVRVYIRECKANIAAIDDGYRVGLLEPAYEVNTLQREITVCDEILQRLG